MELKSIIQLYFPTAAVQRGTAIKLICDPINDSKNINQVLSWPPNIFLILYSLIENTDKYRLIVSHQHESFWTNNDRDIVVKIKNELEIFCSEMSQNFGTANTEKTSKTPLLDQMILTVFSKKNLSKCVYDLFDNPKFRAATFYLLLSIDELFSNINLFTPRSDLEILMSLRALFNRTYDNIADNHSKRGVVTFKSTIPQTGLNINNLTQNLTYIKPAVKPKLVLNSYKKKNAKNKCYNILLLPWPLKVDAISFKEEKTVNNNEMDNYFGFFSYKPSEEIKISAILNTLLSAIRRSGNIDIIVLPELAVSDKIFDRLTSTLYELYGNQAPMVLAGLYGEDGQTSKNAAKISYIDEIEKYTSFEQNKHHRWFLEKNQLRNYNLSNALDPSKKWWEHIGVGRRNLINLLTSDGLKLCPLICEDLARQEPVAQAVRAIGPNLVISLLLDGPQLSGRWPGKYAAVLADDPGSSVLSLTALGMTIRSTGLGFAPSRGVALWSEPGKGSETLNLDDNAVALVLELEMKNEDMWSLDGRAKTKPVLRKIIHTSIEMEYPDVSNANYLKEQVRKELEKVLKW